MSSNGGLPFRFTDERHMKFVELYSREPCLWNRRPQLWAARNAAYKRIQMGINAEAEPTENPITIQGVKMKIKNLRTGYHQELKKIRANPKYTPKIPWFAPLHKFMAQFLDKVKRNFGTAFRLYIQFSLYVCMNVFRIYRNRTKT